MPNRTVTLSLLDGYVLGALVDHDKLPVLIAELIALGGANDEALARCCVLRSACSIYLFAFALHQHRQVNSSSSPLADHTVT
jgi:hypothetical protein